ncbi:signal peptidase II [Psittacicella melopsittaci]|uniref:Lipoprotein signal peptidase n=1 Tax=Psittacicella melopsittaci TaxID=2028576 RepID=A0A3A1Y1N1_9GAMM|nr:signal peptidase II [Psittacicella melopsittaci]RIY31330.1 signal peptidase II [Psittacicella melopsittaci]
MNKNKLLIFSLFLLVVLVALDWYSKYYFDTTLAYLQSVPVLGETFLQWTLVYNYGFSFSIGSNYPTLMRVVVGSFAVIVGVFLVYFASSNLRDSKATKTEKAIAFAQIFIAAGAFGNGLERIAFGRVIDFIHFTFGGTWSFAVFNLADVWINLGIYLIVITYIINYLRNRSN